jgi:signal peptidase I
MTRMQTLRAWNARRRLRRDAYVILKEARRVARRYSHRLSAAQAKTLAARTDELGRALRSRAEVAPAMESLLQLLEGDLSFTRKSTARQYVESIGGVVFVALLLRSFVVEAYQIPSGSMIPTLQVGDHIWVNKLIYGLRIPFTDIKFGTQYRPPRRGEIVVFTHPRTPEMDLIKRVIAVGGDEVEMRDNVVYVNGIPSARTHSGQTHYFDFEEGPQQWVERDADAWQEQMGPAQFTTFHDSVIGLRDFPKMQIPKGTLFFMGDNRDYSNDSRYWGVVPLNLVRGKAMVVWWSYGQPEGVRVRRFGHLIE